MPTTSPADLAALPGGSAPDPARRTTTRDADRDTDRDADRVAGLRPGSSTAGGHGTVVLLAVLGLALWAGLWQAGHPLLGLVAALGLGAGVLRNAAHLLALPWRHGHLVEFVDAWEARTGVEFGRGGRSDDVARALHREWRRGHRHLSAQQYLAVRAAS